MKRAYQKPHLEIESFVLTQQITSCSYLKIGFSDKACVENDTDSTEKMMRLALTGVFSDGCELPPIFAPEGDDGICYHTSINMAFTS
ncbi:MAG: hypothetical protein ACI3VU_05265 [Faecousia sp.]